MSLTTRAYAERRHERRPPDEQPADEESGAATDAATPVEPEVSEEIAAATAPAVPEAVEGDQLPAELDVSAYAGMYTFPDIKRRRWPGDIYLAVATACFVLWAVTRDCDSVLVNGGFLLTAVALLAIGAYHMAAAWPLAVGDSDAR